jgi:Arc/MetJ family transcription regulator
MASMRICTGAAGAAAAGASAAGAAGSAGAGGAGGGTTRIAMLDLTPRRSKCRSATRVRSSAFPSTFHTAPLWATKLWPVRVICVAIDIGAGRRGGLPGTGDVLAAAVVVYHRCMSRTNIDVDDEACRVVMERYQLKTKRDAVNFALRTVAAESLSLEAARRLRGSGWDGDLGELRASRAG